MRKIRCCWARKARRTVAKDSYLVATVDRRCYQAI